MANSGLVLLDFRPCVPLALLLLLGPGFPLLLPECSDPDSELEPSRPQRSFRAFGILR